MRKSLFVSVTPYLTKHFTLNSVISKRRCNPFQYAWPATGKYTGTSFVQKEIFNRLYNRFPAPDISRQDSNI